MDGIVEECHQVYFGMRSIRKSCNSNQMLRRLLSLFVGWNAGWLFLFTRWLSTFTFTRVLRELLRRVSHVIQFRERVWHGNIDGIYFKDNLILLKLDCKFTVVCSECVYVKRYLLFYSPDLIVQYFVILFHVELWHTVCFKIG